MGVIQMNTAVMDVIPWSQIIAIIGLFWLFSLVIVAIMLAVAFIVLFARRCRFPFHDSKLLTFTA